jgi:hypothetical protein
VATPATYTSGKQGVFEMFLMHHIDDRTSGDRTQKFTFDGDHWHSCYIVLNRQQYGFLLVIMRMDCYGRSRHETAYADSGFSLGESS